ncbi:MAG: hypothetical protein U0521_10090 [Anaerolineae bacterium]
MSDFAFVLAQQAAGFFPTGRIVGGGFAIGAPGAVAGDDHRQVVGIDRFGDGAGGFRSPNRFGDFAIGAGFRRRG